METLELTPISNECISIEEYLRRREKGDVKVIGIIPPSFGDVDQKTYKLGSILVETDRPIYGVVPNRC